jgi:hypothetical protein
MAAADALSGRNVWVGVGKQAAFGTPVAPSKFFEVTALSGLLEEYQFKKSDRRVGSRFKPLGFKSAKKVPLSFTVEVNAQNIGLLLMLGFGADAVAAAGAAFKHAASLVDVLPYFTFWASTDLVADTDAADTIHQVINCKVISLKLDGAVDDVLKCTIEAVGTARFPAFNSKAGIAGTGASASPNINAIASTAGIVPGQTITGANIPGGTTVLSVAATSLVMSANASGVVASFSVAAPVPTFPTVRSLYLKAEEGQAKIEVGAAVGSLAEFDEATEFHFSITNGVSPDMRIDTTPNASALKEGDSEMTGSFKVVYNRNSFVEIKAFQAGTGRAIRFTDTSVELAATGQPYKLTLTSDKARYSGAPASFDPDLISADAQFEIEKTAAYPIIEVINTDSAAY